MVNWDAERNDDATIGTSDVLIEGRRGDVNSPRLVLFLKNVSTGGQEITLAMNNNGQAVAGKGKVLSVGQAWVESIDAVFRPWNGDIHAIADAAGGKLAISIRG